MKEKKLHIEGIDERGRITIIIPSKGIEENMNTLVRIAKITSKSKPVIEFYEIGGEFIVIIFCKVTKREGKNICKEINKVI